MLKIENLSKSFTKKLFSNLSLELPAGSMLGLTGSNGSGKTTLSRIILGLEEADTGSILLMHDGEWQVPDERQLRDKVYYVFQNPDHQIVGTIVEDDVAFGAENRNYNHLELSKRVSEAIARTGLSGFEKTNPQMLSGGQKQRLAIAGALAVGADCLILDEPTAMLDQKARQEVRQLIKELLDSGMAILLISHLPDELLLCDRVLVLHEGEHFIYDDPQELYFSGLYEQLGLQPPFAAFGKDFL